MDDSKQITRVADLTGKTIERACSTSGSGVAFVFSDGTWLSAEPLCDGDNAAFLSLREDPSMTDKLEMGLVDQEQHDAWLAKRQTETEAVRKPFELAELARLKAKYPEA